MTDGSCAPGLIVSEPKPRREQAFYKGSKQVPEWCNDRLGGQLLWGALQKDAC